MNAPRRLTLITRRSCELCAELVALLAPYITGGLILLNTLDVDADPALQVAHTWRVPVLLEGDLELMWGKIEVGEVVVALGPLPASLK